MERLSERVNAFENEDYTKFINVLNQDNIQFDVRKRQVHLSIEQKAYNAKLAKYAYVEDVLKKLKQEKKEHYMTYMRLRDKILYGTKDLSHDDITLYDNTVTNLNRIEEDIALNDAFLQSRRNQIESTITNISKNKEAVIKEMEKEMTIKEYLVLLAKIKDADEKTREQEDLIGLNDCYMEQEVRLSRQTTTVPKAAKAAKATKAKKARAKEGQKGGEKNDDALRKRIKQRLVKVLGKK
jgi:hypothetical protein